MDKDPLLCAVCLHTRAHPNPAITVVEGFAACVAHHRLFTFPDPGGHNGGEDRIGRRLFVDVLRDARRREAHETAKALQQ